MLSKDGKEHCACLTGEDFKTKECYASSINSVVMSSEENNLLILKADSLLWAFFFH